MSSDSVLTFLPAGDCPTTYSFRLTLRLAVYSQSVRLGDKLLETHDHRLFQLNPCDHTPHVTSSLTRGWVCRLQSLLVLASAVIFGFKSRGTHDHIFVSDSRPPWFCVRSPYFYPPGTGWSSYTPRHLFPFCHLLRLAAVLLITSRYGPHRKHHFSVAVSNYCRSKQAYLLYLVTAVV
jgi:hypothetical protein